MIYTGASNYLRACPRCEREGTTHIKGNFGEMCHDCAETILGASAPVEALNGPPQILRHPDGSTVTVPSEFAHLPAPFAAAKAIGFEVEAAPVEVRGVVTIEGGEVTDMFDGEGDMPACLIVCGGKVHGAEHACLPPTFTFSQWPGAFVGQQVTITITPSGAKPGEGG